MSADTFEAVCDGCESPLEPGDLRCSICGKAAPASRSAQQTTVVTVLRCKGCGAAVAYDPKKQAPACAFCDSEFAVETIEDPMEQTQGYLPFTVRPDDAAAALKTWLGSLGWFRPSDLLSASKLTELKPLWWVAWVFDADAKITWAADSNYGSRRSSWAPHSGATKVQFERILASASRGLSSHEVNGITGGLQMHSVRDEPEGATDATIERFDVQRSQARRQVAAALDAMAEGHVRQHEIPGSKFRNVKVSVVVEGLVTHRLSLPAYVLAYRYKDQLYRVVICGQNVRYIVGKAPYSAVKIFLTAFIAIVVLLTLVGVFAMG